MGASCQRLVFSETTARGQRASRPVKSSATAMESNKNMKHTDSDCPSAKLDVFRDTPIRYLGYANEVGESFRALVHVNWVRFTYVVASGYVCADAYSKGKAASQVNWPSDKTTKTKTIEAVVDTLIWQGLASVAIPGFTINRICFFSNILLKKTSNLPPQVRKWTVTGLGLACIPFIIKPIDSSVDFLMESTLRKWFSIGPILEERIVHHHRDDGVH